MPIECAEEIHPVTRDQYYQIDERVLRIAFDVHNEFGRFLNEALYQNEIAARCAELGMAVTREMKILVYHGDFQKDYLVDLMVDRCTPIETKTVEALNRNHEAQLLNYLFLTGAHHGSLINLRSTSVKRRFVSTSLTLADRRKFELTPIDWRPLTTEFLQLQQWVMAVLNDWGAFLDFRLYRDAITHFLGGSAKVIRNLPVFSGDREIGKQEVHLLSEEFAFAFSAAKTNRQSMIEHQRRFLHHTQLQGIASINLNGHQIEFTTISK